MSGLKKLLKNVPDAGYNNSKQINFFWGSTPYWTPEEGILLST